MENKQAILSYLDTLYPDAHCELLYTTPFQLLIAVMLSAQTTDKAVNLVTPRLFLRYPTLHDLVESNLEELKELIKSIGIYKTKAKRIQEIARQIENEFHGVVPSTMEQLTSLLGVGRKTASVVLIEAFNVPAFPVDTHVLRVSKRLGLIPEKDDADKAEQKLRQLFPPSMYKKLHHQLIFFGRYHCKAIQPKCSKCALIKICNYEKKRLR